MTVEASPDAPVLRVRGLKVSIAGQQAAVPLVDGVSFELGARETLAIVGESGSGKTITALALMKLLTAAAQVSAEELSFEGTDLLGASDAQMRAIRGNRLAMIFQDPMSSMNPVMTIGRQVAEPLERHQSLGRRAALQRAETLCRDVQIPDAGRRLSQYPHQFSGGMRQRAMIATALACRPRLIIADEPTTALDVTVQAQVISLLKTLIHETGASLILITHDLGLVARIADRVCIMYAGRFVETGSVRRVLKTPSHPYTQGLLASLPRLDRPSADRLSPIRGQPPAAGRWPSGCAFNPRCDFAVATCRTRTPRLQTIADQHQRACLVDVPSHA